MTPLDRYVVRFGAVAGPKMYHAIRSRSALMGANQRRRAVITRVTNRPPADHRPDRDATARSERIGLLPFGSPLGADPTLTSAD